MNPLRVEVYPADDYADGAWRVMLRDANMAPWRAWVFREGNGGEAAARAAAEELRAAA
jgi:hypothetical protein